MRIAQVVSSYAPRVGGVETHVQQLAECLAEAGDQVAVLTHQAGGAPREEWLGPVRVLRFPLTVRPHNYELSLPLFRYLKAHAGEYDLAHVHSYHTLAGHAAVHAGLPFVFTTHCNGTGHTPFRTFLHRLYRPAGSRLLSRAHAVICVSDAERDRLAADFPRVAGKTVVIPNGTSRDLPAPDSGPPAAAHWPAAPGMPVVLTVSRLERYKNVDLIIDAVRALPTEAALVVVGDGPDRPRLERHAEATGPGAPVIFTGAIPGPALTSLLAQAHVVTSASDHEAFGLTLADGLAAGARVVASGIAAHAELARRAGPGAPVALVDPRDRAQFTDLLAAALRAGRDPVPDIKLPSWGDVAADTRELYARILTDSRRQRSRLAGAARPQAARSSTGTGHPPASTPAPEEHP